MLVLMSLEVGYKLPSHIITTCIRKSTYLGIRIMTTYMCAGVVGFIMN